MAGATIVKFQQAIHDLKESWYFRFWAVIWLVGVIVTFASFVVLVAQDRQVAETWYEFSPTMNFPNFHFRVDRASARTFYSMSCTQPDGSAVQFVPCADPTMDGDTTRCRAIQPTVPATAMRHDRLMRSLNCQFITNGTGPEGDIMAFEVEGQYTFAETDGAGDTATWFGPNNNTWLDMKKKVVQLKGFNLEVWDVVPIYHSTYWTQQAYNVTIMIGEFVTLHIQPKELYSGWLVYGAIGGTGFFMVIIQTILMALLGICLSNNSVFLSSGAPNAAS